MVVAVVNTERANAMYASLQRRVENAEIEAAKAVNSIPDVDPKTAERACAALAAELKADAEAKLEVLKPIFDETNY